jgi:hypothetical protein
MENLKRLDIRAIKEIQDELKQMEEKECDSLPKKLVPEERH